VRLPTLLLLFSALLPAQTTAFEGTAIHSITKQPLEGVHVRLIGFSFDGPGDTYGAMSDRAGHFSIATMKPGAYMLLPEYRGFVHAHKKEGPLPFAMITLKAGESVADFHLEMTPHSVITGRVLDEYGDPVQNAQVQAEAASPETAVVGPGFLDNSGNGNTDDRGSFRLVMGPGKYYVKAEPPNSNNPNGPPEKRTDGTAPSEYTGTWYPSAASKDRAVAVEVQAGAEAGVDIRLTRAVAQRMLTMSGVVHGIPEGNLSTYVQLVPSDNMGGSMPSARVGPDGQFTFSRVRPGTYRLTALSMGDKQLHGPPLEVKLESDLANVELPLTGAGELTGILDFPGVPAEKRTIYLKTTGGFSFGQPPSGEVAQDATFHIPGLAGGHFTVQVEPLPENAYISSLTLDGKTIPGAELELPPGMRSSKLKVTVKPDGAQISGVLLDPSGNKLSVSFAIAMLVDDPAKLELEGDSRNMARVGADGKYSFHGIRPGKYRVLAIDLFHSPDFNLEKPGEWKKLAASLEEFEIKAGDRLVKDVKVVAQEDANAKPKL